MQGEISQVIVHVKPVTDQISYQLLAVVWFNPVQTNDLFIQ